ncbi:serine hydrolase domain-containing protein [Halapricum salinum]|uniref:Class A beta-lactamase-related serine hydrolase n=1 Tax=Halapricum salinum TaxID=1457250 RepID=A0A4D6H8Y5_9EURY|nr:serine hydrolase domain-containing protein [Halapricum salinum]QCC50373.1 class A beta-lactamase-related serine hydrolase [Halapricum salinum]
MECQEAKSRLESRLQSAVEDNSELHSAYLLVHSDSRDLHWNLATGQTAGIEADPEQPYYAASIGKTFTSTIVAMLAEDEQLSFDDPISEYLSESLLDGLHTINGTDYTDDIRIRHLLGHTSGLPHSLPEGGKMFFNTRLEESPEGKTLFDEMMAEPDRIWEPEETIEWAKHNLESHFSPGEDCYYSEFGYNLLGLLIENVTEQPYHEALAEFLFDPLEMEHSYLPPFSDPAVENELPTAPFYIDEKKIDVDDVPSLSAFYAGGQTVNTAEELFRFHRALVEGELVSEETLQKMQQWNKLWQGIDYGYGIVRIRPLPFLKRFHCWGGLGASSAFMVYNPTIDVYLIGTFNQWSYMRKSMMFLFQTLRSISKVERPGQ